MALVYEFSDSLSYDVTEMHFMGSKRHDRLAKKSRPFDPVEPQRLIEYLANHITEHFKNLDWLRFHSLDGIVILYVLPSPQSRKVFYDNRLEILAATGWYPAIMGDRADFNLILPQKKELKGNLRGIGSLLGFKVNHNEEGAGVSFELEGTQGTYLFDFGYHGSTNSKISAVFLSHTHEDHSGGLLETIQNRSYSFPIICSKPSALYIRDLLKRKSIDYEGQNIIYIEGENEIELENNMLISFFKVYHSPESIGFRVCDNLGTSFFYFGDLCLRNGYANFFEYTFEILNSLKGKRNFILLDGAMIGRNNAIEKEDTPETVLEEFSLNVDRRNIFIVGNQPENLIYSYLTVYKITHDLENLKNVKIVISPRLMDSLRLLLEPIVKNQNAFKDPVFKFLFGESKINPIETHRLYPLNEKVLSEIDSKERLIVFASDKEIQKFKFLGQRIEKSDVVLTGTFALRENLPDILSKTKPRSILRVSSENWGFHSSEADLKAFLDKLELGDEMKVYLFHNYKERLDKFVKRSQFNLKLVISLPNRATNVRF